jgi:hypothetical protein
VEPVVEYCPLRQAVASWRAIDPDDTEIQHDKLKATYNNLDTFLSKICITGVTINVFLTVGGGK